MFRELCEDPARNTGLLSSVKRPRRNKWLRFNDLWPSLVHGPKPLRVELLIRRQPARSGCCLVHPEVQLGLTVKIQGKLIRMRSRPYRVKLRLDLILNPFVNDVLGKDVTLQQELMIFFQRCEGFFQAAGSGGNAIEFPAQARRCPYPAVHPDPICFRSRPGPP